MLSLFSCTPQIVYNGLQVGDLFVCQTGDIQRAFVFQPQQVICVHMECGADFDEHINGWLDIAVFPIADTLFGDVEFAAKFYLIHR